MKYPSLQQHLIDDIEFRNLNDELIVRSELANPDCQLIIRFKFYPRIRFKLFLGHPGKNSIDYSGGFIYAPYIPMGITSTLSTATWKMKRQSRTGSAYSINKNLYTLQSFASPKQTFYLNLNTQKLYFKNGSKIKQIKIKKRKLMPLIRHILKNWYYE